MTEKEKAIETLKWFGTFDMIRQYVFAQSGDGPEFNELLKAEIDKLKQITQKVVDETD